MVRISKDTFQLPMSIKTIQQETKVKQYETSIRTAKKKKNGNRNTHTLVPYAARIIKIKETKNKIK